jgi:hypothetical protein
MQPFKILRCQDVKNRHMKLFIVTIIIVAILLSGCKKTQTTIDSLPNIDTTIGDFSAIIDGQQWIATDSTRSASLLNSIFTISGTSSDGQTITISLADTTPGTYMLSKSSASIATYTESNTYSGRYFSTNQSNNSSLAGGMVVVKEIDKINKTISGTFTLNMYVDSNGGYKKVITEGVFNDIPYINSLPLASITDTFNVQINGTNWKAQSIILTQVNGQYFLKGSALDASKSVGIYFNFGSFDDSDFTYYGFLGKYNNEHTSSFNSYDSSSAGDVTYISSNGSLTITNYDSSTGRLRGNFYFNAYAANFNFYPPSSQGNFVFMPPNQPSQLKDGFFSIQFKP